MSNLCCNDDYNSNGLFDAVDKDIFSVFITECLTNSEGCPTSVEQISEVWTKAVNNQQVSDLQGTIDHLPTLECSDFNLNGKFDATDKDIYDIFVTECLTSSSGCPKSIDDLLAVWPKAVANQQVSDLQSEIKMLPRLEGINCTPTPTNTPTDLIQPINVKLYLDSHTDEIIDFTNGDDIPSGKRIFYLLSNEELCYEAEIEFVDGSSGVYVLPLLGKFKASGEEYYFYSMPWRLIKTLVLIDCTNIDDGFGDGIGIEPTVTPTPTQTQTPTQTLTPTQTPTQTPRNISLENCEDYDNTIRITKEVSNNSEILSFRGIAINGFEEGGHVCINELSEELESIVCPFATEDFSVMGMITLSQKPLNSIIIYMSKSGDTYQGELVDIPETGMSLLIKQ